MLHWYCKATYNLGQFFFPKTTYNLGRREYYLISGYVSRVNCVVHSVENLKTELSECSL